MSSKILRRLKMKKSIILFVVLLIIVSSVLTGCTSNETFTEQTYSAEESEIQSLVIDVIDREVKIELSDDGKVHIDYFQSEKEFYDIGINEDKTLIVKYSSDKNWTDFLGKKTSPEYRKIIVKLPEGILKKLSVKTTNEDITLGAVSASEDILLDVNGGNLNFENISVGNSLTLNAKNGNISGKITGGYDDFSITCKIKKGECNLPDKKADGEKSLVVDCNNGDTLIEFIKK